MGIKQFHEKKKMQKLAGCAPQSIPQPSFATQTMCQKKALSAATLEHQPDRLIMSASFGAKRCSNITA